VRQTPHFAGSGILSDSNEGAKPLGGFAHGYMYANAGRVPDIAFAECVW
jgi:hypothetical protein